MQNQPTKNNAPKGDQKDQNDAANTNDDAVEEDGTPVLEEEDLEENNINEDEAEEIEWDEPKE